MLRLNLSTRPFYNERAIYVVLALLAAGIVAVSVLNARQLLALSARQTALQVQINGDEAKARDLRQRATRLNAELNQDELQVVLDEAREANSLIDRRTFSWTELFNHLEATLPADVMLTAVKPGLSDGQVTITMNVVGRQVEDIETFIGRLEKTGVFSEMLTTEEHPEESGTILVTLVGNYGSPRSSAAGSAVRSASARNTARRPAAPPPPAANRPGGGR